MSFSITCPNCGDNLKAKDKHLGKKLACPKCKEPFTVKAPMPEVSEPAVEALVEDMTLDPSMDADLGDMDLGDFGMGDGDFGDLGAIDTSAGGGVDLAEASFGTGGDMGPGVPTAPMPYAYVTSAKPQPAPSRKTSVINSGNVMVLCSGAGLMLGVLTALVLGVLDGSAVMSFEMGFYVFAGLVLGTLVGGGIGFALSPFLPDASAEASAEQLAGGLFRVIGGFMLTGVGLVSFGVFSEMDDGKGGPDRMPGIAIALYELLGKWGVLVILGGAGITMVVLGVRAMLPSKEDR